jgi:hypothetical protein
LCFIYFCPQYGVHEHAKIPCPASGYLGREAGWKAESGWEVVAVGWVKWPRLDLQKLPTLTKRLVDGGDLMGMVTAQITSLSHSLSFYCLVNLAMEYNHPQKAETVNWLVQFRNSFNCQKRFCGSS